MSLLPVSTLLSGCEHPAESGQRPQRASAVPVVVGKVERRDVPVRLRALGRAEASATVTVLPRVTGQVEEIHFEEGQEVGQGARLFTLDRRPFEIALSEAEARLARDQALAADALSEEKRVSDLFARGSAGERERDAAKAQSDSLAAAVRADEAAVRQARLLLEYCAIKSPIEGRTGTRLVDVGTVVSENSTALVVVNRLDPVEVSFAVAEQHLRDIKQAMSAGALRVEAQLESESTPVVGELTFIDNAVDATTGMIRLKAVFPNADRRLWPGLFVRVVVTLRMQRDAVVAPRDALQYGQQGEFVYVIGPDRAAEMRAVVSGARQDDFVVIAEGLEGDETVVTNGHLRLVPGALVEIKAPDAASKLDTMKGAASSAPASSPSSPASPSPIRNEERPR